MMQAKNYEYDVRGIRFFMKDAPQDQTTQNIFFCLGHFSCIEAVKLATTDNKSEKKLSPLQRIEKDLCERDHYVKDSEATYLLYLLKRLPAQGDYGHAAVDEFWSNSKRYTSFVRLHCARKTANELLSECLEEALRKTTHTKISTNSDNTLTVTMASNKTEKVTYLFYDSLELGDAVVILRADSLAAIMYVMEALHTLESVRNTYTYHGISPSTLKQKKETWGTNKIYASTRFSLSKKSQDILKDPSSQTAFKNKINGRQCAFVTGATDYLVDWGVIQEKELIAFFSEMHSNPTLRPLLLDAITRIGLPRVDFTAITPPSSNAPDTKKIDNLLEKIEKKLIGPSIGWDEDEAVQKMSTIEDTYTKLWFTSLSDLVKSFVKMAQNPVTDDLSLLLLPGIGALLSQIASRLDKEDENWNPALDEGVNSFLSDCISLANNISNLESQLYQRPELTPAHSYIPATLLRFAQQFAQLCCKAFVSKDKKPPRQYIPLVTTTQYRNIRTACPIENVENDQPDDCPIQIYLPINTLYHPWTAAITLCHEAAHYSGIHFRRRDDRLTCLSECMAFYITSTWAIDLQHTPQEISSQEYKDSFAARIEEYTQTFEQYAANDKHLRYALEMLCRKGKEIYSSRKELERFSDLYIANGQFSPQEKIQLITYYNSIQPFLPLESIDEHFKIVIKYYCRECYADIAMLILLNCSMEDYYLGVFKQEFSWIHIADFKNHKILNYGIKRFVDRIAFVMDAMIAINMWQEQDIDNLPDKDKWVFHRANRQLHGQWNDSEYDNYYSLYKSEIDSLKKYFRKCAQALNAERCYNLSYRKKMDRVRKALKSVNDCSFDLEHIQEFLSSRISSDSTAAN